MNPTTNARIASTESRSVWIFFLLVFLLAAPFYVLGALYGEAWAKLIPITLPLSALIFVTPLLAASILTYREQGWAGVKALLKRAFDYRRIKNKRWLLPVLFLFPAIMLLEYGLMVWLGRPLPDFEFPLWLVPVFIVVFFIGGIFEELGWTTYATDRLQVRWTALQTSLIIGVVWALLHAPADLQAARALDWIVAHRLATIVLRIIIVWLYNNTGRSAFAVILFHDMVNVALYMFPNYGSHYDPFLTLLLSGIVAAIAIVAWGPETLARYRFGRVRGTKPSGTPEQITTRG